MGFEDVVGILSYAAQRIRKAGWFCIRAFVPPTSDSHLSIHIYNPHKLTNIITHHFNLHQPQKPNTSNPTQLSTMHSFTSTLTSLVSLLALTSAAPATKRTDVPCVEVTFHGATPQAFYTVPVPLDGVSEVFTGKLSNILLSSACLLYFAQR